MLSWREWRRVGVALAVGLLILGVLHGCGWGDRILSPFNGSWNSKPPEPVVKEIVEGTTRTIIKTVFVQDYMVLNVIGGLSALICFATIMIRAFGIPIPWRPTSAAFACMICSWVVRSMLVEYTWLMALLSVLSLILGGAAIAYGHRRWFERQMGVDLDRNGRVG